MIREPVILPKRPRLSTRSSQRFFQLVDVIARANEPTSTDLEDLERSYNSTGEFLSACPEFRGDLIQIHAHGSRQLGTIVRPRDGSREGFDIDLIARLVPSARGKYESEHGPALLLDRLHCALNRYAQAHGLQLRRWERCVTLEYAGGMSADIAPVIDSPLFAAPFGDTHGLIPDRALRLFDSTNPRGYAKHFDLAATISPNFTATEALTMKSAKIDVAPCIKERLQADVWEVCNRDANVFEKSNPLDYTDWLIQRNSICGSNNFRKATRLLKYLRDIKKNFTCPSFLLTTLLGMQVNTWDQGATSFADVPTTLKTLVGRLDDWLQANPIRPTVRNPVLFEEIQSAAWDDTKYSNFRAKINLYRGWIDDAYDESDKEESIGKWQRVFGEDFAAQATSEIASTVSKAALSAFRGSAIADGAVDLVALVKKIGRAALPHGFDRLPHMRRPRWRAATGTQLTVNVGAQLWTSRYGQRIRPIASLSLMQPGYWIRFNASNNLGLPFPDTYKIHWRVTNTDEVARRENALRGDYYPSDEPWIRWERLSYRGVHMVEAFLVRRADEMLLGKSDPFYVAIE